MKRKTSPEISEASNKRYLKNVTPLSNTTSTIYPLYLTAETVETPELIQLAMTNRELYRLIVWDDYLWRKAALRFTGDNLLTTQYNVLFQYMMETSSNPTVFWNLRWQDVQNVKLTQGQLNPYSSTSLLQLMMTLLNVFPENDTLYVNNSILSKEDTPMDEFLTQDDEDGKSFGMIWPLAFNGSYNNNNPLFVTGPRTRCTLKFSVENPFDDYNSNLTNYGYDIYSKEHVFTGCITSEMVEELHGHYLTEVEKHYGVENATDEMRFAMQNDEKVESLMVKLTLIVNDVEVFHFTSDSY